MFKAKKGPYILIGLLAIVLFFILGLQYGKFIKRTDQEIAFKLSLTPSIKPTQATTKIETYKLFEQENCNISFLYPSSFTIKNDASNEAVMTTTTGQEGISLICNDTSQAPKVSTQEAILDNENAIIYVESKDYRKIRLLDRENKIVSIYFLKELEPLIINSFKFTE